MALLPAMSSMGAGYQLNLQGIRQLAMGGSGTAWTWDAASVFYNPGMLSDMNHFQVYASGLVLIPHIQYADNNTGILAQTQNKTYYPFNIYAGGPVTKDGRLGVGIGVYTPFGSGTKWDDDWTGRYVIQEIKLQSIFVQPTVSYRLNDYVSIGGGFVYAFGNVDLRKAVPIQGEGTTDGEAQLKGNAHGIGYNLGVHLRPTDNFQFGLTYRSKVDMKVNDGTATFTDIPTSVAGNFTNTKFTSKLPLPHVLSVGFGYRFFKHLTLTADFDLVGWKAYDTLRFDYAQTSAAVQNTRAARQYRNQMSFRLGANYKINDAVSIMAGTAYDPSPARDQFVSPDLPDANRYIITGGIAVKPAKQFCIMAAVEFVNAVKRDAQDTQDFFGGTYQTKDVTLGLGLSYSF